MSFLKFCSLLVLAVLATADDVVVLTKTNFESILDGSKNVFVKFYAPWCGHCKALAPTWDLLGAAFVEEEDVVIAKLDATQEEEIAKKFEIKGYPTLSLFKKGSTDPVQYRGERTIVGLVEAVNELAGTFRRSDGSFDDGLGTVDDIRQELEKASCENKSKMECLEHLIAIAKNAAATATEKLGDGAFDGASSFVEKCTKYYSTALKKVQQNSDFFASELTRLTGLMKSSDVAADIKQYVVARKNILSELKKAVEEKLAKLSSSNDEL